MDVETRVSESIPLLKEKNDFEKFDTEPDYIRIIFSRKCLRKLVFINWSYDEFIDVKYKTIDRNTLKIVSEQDYNPDIKNID